MPKNQLRILAENLHDTATLTATSEALPIANTQISRRSSVWRSTSAAEQVITGDLAVPSNINCIAIFQHNLGADGITRIEVLRGEDVVYDTGPVSTAIYIPAGIWRAGVDPWEATYNDQLPGNTPLSIVWLPSISNATGYRISLAGAGVQGYHEIGRIMVGAYFSPTVNFSWNPKVEWIESAEHLRTEGGSLYTVGGGDIYRRISINLDHLTDADRTQLIVQLGKAGQAGDLLVSLYPEAGAMLALEHTMVCRRIVTLSTTHDRYSNWKLPLTFEEV